MLPLAAAVMMRAFSKQSSGVAMAAGSPQPVGGITSMLAPTLNSNRDGSILDDVASMIGRFTKSGVGARNDPKRRMQMSVAKVSEISSTSANSFEDAIQQGLKRAGKTIRNIRSAWIKEQHVRLDKGKIAEYQVNMMVTFVVDD